MTRMSFAAVRVVAIVPLLLAASGCGGDAATVTPTPIVPTAVVITPPAPPIAFGALGRTAQLVVVVTGSNGSPITAPTVTWTSLSPGVATVSGTGLVTAVANGSANITATSGTITSASVTVTVTQVVATVVVTSTSATPDTLVTATRTRQFTGTTRDSTGNVVAGTTLAWTSNATGVATVGAATGLVTAGTISGLATIQAGAGATTGTRTIVVRHFPATLTIAPKPAAITTFGGTQLFTGVAQDSVGTNLPITWVSSNSNVATVAPASGTSTTATALINGLTNVSILSGIRTDSSVLTVTGQVVAPPSTIAVSVGDFFFKSGRNLTQNAAVDTLAVGGTVTWTWVGGASHSVQSIGAPTFTSSTPPKTSGTYSMLFNTVGTYQYNCGIHLNGMTGTVVVR